MKKMKLLLVLLSFSYLFAQDFALNFDGMDDYVSIGHSGDFTMSAVTIEMWFYWQNTTDLDAVEFLIGKNYEELEIHIGGGSGENGLRFIPTTGVWLDVANAFTSEKWYHIAFSYNPAGDGFAQCFINGIEKNMVNNGGNPLTTGLQNTSSNLTLGQRTDGTLRFNGFMDEVRIWNTVRTETEINDNMYQALQYPESETNLAAYYSMTDGDGTFLTDNSGNNNSGTLNNGVGWYAYCLPIEPEGSGTESDKYLISTINNLVWLSENSDIWITDSYYLQTADIDASDSEYWNNGAGFIPIGYSSPNSFRGNYDGGGHIIRGITIFLTEMSITPYDGIFGYIIGATISNLGAVDINIIGRDPVGGLIGLADRSVITNCYTTGYVGGAWTVGGFVGEVYRSTIRNCYSLAEVARTSGASVNLGGFVGEVGPFTPNIIENCYSAGYVNGFSGFCSEQYYTATLIHNYWDIETSGSLTGAGIGETTVTGKTTAEMKDLATFSNWDFDEIWDILPSSNEFTSYPYLRVFSYDEPEAEPIYNPLPGFRGRGYEVELDKQGGIGGADSIIATYLEAMPSAIAPTKTGYSFMGYFTEINGGGTQFYNGEMESLMDWNIPQNSTLFAFWNINSYTLTFDTGGGTEISPITQPYNTPITAPPDPSKEGYQFDSWDEEIPATMPAENKTFTAQWIGSEYLVTLDKQTGIGGTDTITAIFGSPMPEAVAPTKIGYSFVGYFSETNGDGVQYYNEAMESVNNWNISQNTTLYANWIINSYTLTFDTGGGTEISPITQPYNTEITAPADPEKEGYVFDSWDEEIPTTMPAEDKTFTAQWIGLDYTVTFDKQGGIGGSDIVIATFDSPMPEAISPTLVNYIFTGYFSEINGNGTQYYDSFMESVANWNIAQNTSIYAYWEHFEGFAPGSGDGSSEEQAFLVATKEHLNNVRNFPSSCFRQIEDIEFTEADFAEGGDFYNEGTGWLPITTETFEWPGFRGLYDGNFKTISGLYINRGNFGYQGLFGTVLISGDSEIISIAYLKNILLVDVNITGLYNVGGLVGYLDNGEIYNCSVSGTINGNQQVGGLVGHNFAGKIKQSYADCDVAGNQYVGGLVGLNGWSYPEVTDCYSAGSVSGEYMVGGFIGNNYRGIINNSYSYSAVNASTTENIGGLIGGNNNGVYNNCFWDIGTSGQDTSAGGTGKTTLEMLQQATYFEWDFDTIWGFMEGNYPYLSWQQIEVTELAIPQNIQIQFTDSNVIITWSAVENASSYLIYSSLHPSEGFTVDLSGEFYGTMWTSPVIGSKRFYYLQASTEDYSSKSYKHPKNSHYKDGIE